MRFIIREQDYEKLLAAGRLKYRSGGFESWRLTEAVDGFQVMRIDFDRREEGVDDGLLIHLLFDADGRLERLKLEHVASPSPVSVAILAGDGLLTISRSDENGKDHAALEQPPGFGLLLPGLIGLGLAVRGCRDKASCNAIELNSAEHYKPYLTTIEITQMKEETIAVTGQELVVRPYLIRRDELTYTTWLDDYGIPVRVDDQEGNLAIDDRYMRHR